MASGKAGLDFSALSGKPTGYRDITAAGTGQTTATALASYSAMYYNVTGADGTKGVRLPAGAYLPGKFIIVANIPTASGACPVYPAVGGTINGQSANTAYTLAPGAEAFFFGSSTANSWNTLGASGGASGAGAFNAITITDPTTPSLTTQAGSTNTGFLLVNGKTSGSIKITTADATAQAITISGAAQTVGAATLTIPDMAGANRSIVFNSALASGFSTSTTGSGFTSDTYLLGSAIAMPSGGFVAGAKYICQFDMAKGGGTANLVITLRIGAGQAITDAAILTFTYTGATNVADAGIFLIEAHFRTVGSGTSAVVAGTIQLSHHLAATGFTSIGASGFGYIAAVSSGFNSTTAGTFIGVSVNGGASFAGVNTVTESYLNSY